MATASAEMLKFGGGLWHALSGGRGGGGGGVMSALASRLGRRRVGRRGFRHPDLGGMVVHGVVMGSCRVVVVDCDKMLGLQVVCACLHACRRECVCACIRACTRSRMLAYVCGCRGDGGVGWEWGWACFVGCGGLVVGVRAWVVGVVGCRGALGGW